MERINELPDFIQDKIYNKIRVKWNVKYMIK